MEYILKDEDEIVMTGKQLREYKEIVQKESYLEVADKKVKIRDWRTKWQSQ